MNLRYVLLVWLLLQPRAQPGVWAWSIIGSYETSEACEIARWDQPYHDHTICAELPE